MFGGTQIKNTALRHKIQNIYDAYETKAPAYRRRAVISFNILK
jgi:hypothetical protein